MSLSLWPTESSWIAVKPLTPYPRFLFGGTVFLASFLLFLVEPIAAKQLLPVFGGSAAVWLTCLVFFQTALVGAYAYAHWLTQSGRWKLHFSLLLIAAASAVLWGLIKSNPHGSAEHPFLAILITLTLSIGLPFLALGATSPLIQVWISRLAAAGVPYRIFALSNLASLLALGLYPTLIEPHSTLRIQRLAWCGGFAGFAVISAIVAWRVQSGTQSARTEPESEAGLPKTTVGRKLLWFLLPMAAAMQLTAVTSHLSANVAAIPLLWILPLGVYLLTIIAAFEFPRFIHRGILTRFLVVMLASLGYMLLQVDATLPLRISITFFLVELLVACLFCHAEAYALRPKRPSETTLFYLIFAAGGAAGSFLVAIASPLIFSFNYDLALSFLITAVLALTISWSSGWGQRLLWSTASLLLMILVFRIHSAYRWDTPVAVRNFYGSLRVKQNYTDGYMVRTLTSGTIQHGTQIFSPALKTTPTTYYAEDSGVGLTLRFCCLGRPRNIGVIGLGAGTVAAYGRSGDRIRFYEINPAVRPIAEHLFTYIRDSGAQITFAKGDARSSLAHEEPQNFDVLVIDAFSGDAIPLHLLTTQALAVYQRHIVPNGVLALHVSNQYVDLEPEIFQLSKASGMEAMTVWNPKNESRGEFSSTWVIVTNNDLFFQQPQVAGRVRPPHENLAVRPWTDDYSSLVPILRW